MEVFWTEKRAVPARPVGLFWVFLAGVLVGLLFLIVAQLDTKWFLFLFFGGLIFAASLVPVDKKAFYLVLLVFTIPIGIDLNLYFQPSAFRRSTYGFLIHLSHIPLVALYLIWGFRCVAGKFLFQVSTRGLVPLSALFVSGVISVFLARDPLFGAFDLFALTTSILLFIYAASEIRELQEVRLVLFVLMVSMALQGTIAIGQHLTGSTLGLEFFGASLKYSVPPGLATLTRVAGTLGHPNSLALFFDLLLPLGFSLLFCPIRRRTKLLLAAAVGLGATGLAVTLSRGGVAAVGLALLVILLIRWREWIGLLRGTLAVVIVSMLFVLMVFGTSNPMQERFFRHDYGAAYGRIPHIQVALKMIHDRPFFGVGMNNYTDAARQYDTTPEQIVSLWNSPVHNLFLFIASEIGLIGLISFLFFILTVVLALLPAIRSPDPFVASIGLGLLMGLSAHLAHVQVDYSLWPSFGIFWFLLGLAVSVGRLASPASEG